MAASKKKAPTAQLKPYHFKPGQSGNPAGRPPGRSVTDVARTALGEAVPGGIDRRPAVERIVETLLKQAIAGDHEALLILLDRTEGPLARAVEASQAAALSQVIIHLPHNGRDPLP